MFRKIISNLAFSPALVGRLSTYARRLRKEELTRRFAVVFMIMAIVIQSFAVFSPPEAANASSDSDLIRGGIDTVDELLGYYDNDHSSMRAFFTSLGLTRAELRQTVSADINPSGRYMWSLNSIYRYANASHTYHYINKEGASIAASYRTIPATATLLPTFVGHSSALGWFAVSKNSGNLLTLRPPVVYNTTNTKKSVTTASPFPLKYTVSARSISDTDDFVTTKLVANERIGYTITVTNSSKDDVTTTVSLPLRDVVEYANLVDNGGGVFDTSARTLAWSFSLAPKQTQTRTFVVRIMDPIPATNIGTTDADSYDCTLTIAFGNTLRLPVNCPPQKTLIEQAIATLPTTGTPENIVFGTVSLLVVLYFYLRSVQLKNEVRFIRRDIHNGTL